MPDLCHAVVDMVAALRFTHVCHVVQTVSTKVSPLEQVKVRKRIECDSPAIRTDLTCWTCRLLSGEMAKLLREEGMARLPQGWSRVIQTRCIRTAHWDYSRQSLSEKAKREWWGGVWERLPQVRGWG